MARTPKKWLGLLRRGGSEPSNRVDAIVALAPALVDPLAFDPMDLEQGIVFVMAMIPPRVGTKLRLRLVIEGNREIEVAALVVWAKTPRFGVLPGYGAKLESPSEDVLDALRDLAASIRKRAMEHTALVRRSVIDKPIRETLRDFPAPQSESPESPIEDALIRIALERSEASQPPPSRPPAAEAQDWPEPVEERWPDATPPEVAEAPPEPIAEALPELPAEPAAPIAIEPTTSPTRAEPIAEVPAPQPEMAPEPPTDPGLRPTNPGRPKLPEVVAEPIAPVVVAPVVVEPVVVEPVVVEPVVEPVVAPVVVAPADEAPAAPVESEESIARRRAAVRKEWSEIAGKLKKPAPIVDAEIAAAEQMLSGLSSEVEVKLDLKASARARTWASATERTRTRDIEKAQRTLQTFDDVPEVLAHEPGSSLANVLADFARQQIIAIADPEEQTSFADEEPESLDDEPYEVVDPVVTIVRTGHRAQDLGDVLPDVPDLIDDAPRRVSFGFEESTSGPSSKPPEIVEYAADMSLDDVPDAVIDALTRPEPAVTEIVEIPEIQDDLPTVTNETETPDPASEFAFPAEDVLAREAELASLMGLTSDEPPPRTSVMVRPIQLLQPRSGQAQARLRFESAPLFLAYYDRYLSRELVHVPTRVPPRPGTPLLVMIELPQGQTPVLGHAIVILKPPDAPLHGCTARLVADGRIAKRLAEVAETLRQART